MSGVPEQPRCVCQRYIPIPGEVVCAACRRDEAAESQGRIRKVHQPKQEHQAKTVLRRFGRRK